MAQPEASYHVWTLSKAQNFGSSVRFFNGRKSGVCAITSCRSFFTRTSGGGWVWIDSNTCVNISDDLFIMSACSFNLTMDVPNLLYTISNTIFMNMRFAKFVGYCLNMKKIKNCIFYKMGTLVCRLAVRFMACGADDLEPNQNCIRYIASATTQVFPEVSKRDTC